MSVRLLGCEVFAVEYGDHAARPADVRHAQQAPPERPVIESSGGGHFEFGFDAPGVTAVRAPATTGDALRIGQGVAGPAEE